MVLGMSLPAFTAAHVLLALIGIVAGLIAMWGLLRGSLLRGWTWLFLLMALAVSITGFMFPVTALKPSHAFGVVTLVLLALAVTALVVKRLDGRWRTVYVVSAMLTLYLNVVVLIVQMFEKVAPLAELTQTKGVWPLIAVQGVVLVSFVAATALGALRFRPSPMHLA